MEDALEPSGSEAAETEAEVESAELTTDEVEVEGAEVESVVEDSPSYTVKVGGEELTVSIDELRNGYQRQADYTRKTQELAAEREQVASLRRLEAALNSDPVGTIEALRQVFGVQSPDAELEELDPLEKEVRELRQWREQQEATARQQQYKAEASAAAAKHDLDVPAEDLLAFAVDNQIGNLDVAARLLKTEKVAEATAARTAQVTTKKRTAAVVEGGRTRTAEAAQPTRFKSFRESFEAALKSHT